MRQNIGHYFRMAYGKLSPFTLWDMLRPEYWESTAYIPMMDGKILSPHNPETEILSGVSCNVTRVSNNVKNNLNLPCVRPSDAVQCVRTQQQSWGQGLIGLRYNGRVRDCVNSSRVEFKVHECCRVQSVDA